MAHVPIQTALNNLVAIQTMSNHGGCNEVASDLLGRFVGLEYIAQIGCQFCCNFVSE